MYADINNDSVPPMTDLKKMQEALANTLPDQKVFLCPFTNEPYRLNAKAEGQPWQGDADLPLVYEGEVASDKTRAVLFNDGHVARLAPADWEAVRKKYKITTPVEEEEEAKLSNLRALGVAVLGYANDGDKRLPPLSDLPAAKKAMLPYTGMKDIFADPETGAAYAANGSLAGKRISDVANPTSVIVFYETKPKQDKRGVLFLDGHVERVAESKWPEMKTAAKLR